MTKSPALDEVGQLADRCIFDEDEIRKQIRDYQDFVDSAVKLLPAEPTAEEAPYVGATLLKIEEVQAELEILRARIDFDCFIEYCLTDDDTTLPIRQSLIHRRWSKLCSEHKNLIIWAHRNSGKTTQISVARTVWELGRDPTLRFLILSNTAEIAVRIVKSIAALIEENPMVKKIFPHLKKNPKGPWTNTQLQVVRDTNSPSPSVRASGIHGAVTGARVDRCIVDDILDFENTNTEAERKKTMAWYKATVPGCFTRRIRVTIVGTAYHPSDFIHEMAAVKGYVWKRFPLISSTGKITWPEAWDEARIEDRRNDLGPAEFARQFLCKARDDGEARFKQEWIDAALKKGIGVPLLTSIDELLDEMSVEDAALVKVFTGVDLSTGKKKKKKTDLTSFFTLLQYPNGDRRVAMIDAGKFTGPVIIEKIEQNHKAFRSIIAVEDNGCFPPESPVLTSAGYKPIVDVVEGDLVLTHKGHWKRVLEQTRSLFSGELLGLKASGALEVFATPNHAFQAKKSGRVQGSRTAPDVGKYRPQGEPEWVSCSELQSSDKSTWANYVGMPDQVWPEMTPALEVTRYSSKRTIEVTENLALWLGLFLAEGSVNNKMDQVTFSFHQSEQYLRAFVSRVSREVFDASSAERQGEGLCRTITVNSCEAKQICKQIGKSVSKALPFEWMGWPLKLRLAVVRGWLLGDGCLMFNNVKTVPQRHLVGQSISRNLITQMRATLVQAGFRPSLLPIASKTGCIGGRDIHGKASFKLSLCRDDSARLLESAITDIERIRWLDGRRPSPPAKKDSGSPLVFGDGLLWGKVKKKTGRSYTGFVYNLIVEDDQSYVVQDLAVHNSQSYILQFASEGSNVPVVPHTTGKAKRDPVLGVEGLAIELANGKWIIPCASMTMIHPEIAAWITEMLFFDPKAHTGDRLMSCYFAREVARRFAGEARAVPGVAVRVLGGDGPSSSQQPVQVYQVGTSLKKLFDVPDLP